jgi:predicted double-glycine peptidase
MKAVHTLALLGLLLTHICAKSATPGLLSLGGTPYVIKLTSIKESKFKATTRQQYDFSCGSAAVATLLTHHYGHPTSEQEVFEAMFAKGDQQKIRREGFSLLDIKDYLKRHRFQADGFELPLVKLLESGLPAIVLIAEKGYHHFVVIKGMRDGRVLIGVPSVGTRAVSQTSFESIWVDKLLFVIHNRIEQAVFNREADWQVTPRAPLRAGLQVDGLANVTLPKFGPTDF